MMMMQPSLTAMKTIKACEQALHLWDIERSHAQVAREERRVSNVRVKKVRAYSRVCLPLEMKRLLPLHNISWLSCAFAIRLASLP